MVQFYFIQLLENHFTFHFHKRLRADVFKRGMKTLMVEECKLMIHLDIGDVLQLITLLKVV